MARGINPALGTTTFRLTSTHPGSNPFTPPVPAPTTDVNNLRACVEALKAGVESLTGQRGDATNRAVTFRDLIGYGVLNPAAVQSPSGSAPVIPPVDTTAYLPLTGGVLDAPGNLTVNGTTSLAAATATTPPTADNSTKVATTAFVKAQGYTNNLGTVTSITAGTGLTGGTITGIGTIALSVPVSVANGGTGATTVAGSPFLPLTGGTVTGALKVSTTANPAFGIAGTTYGIRFFQDGSGSHIEGVDSTLVTSYQPLTLSGSGVYAPTPATGDNSTQIATTAFVKAQGYASGGPYLPIAGGTVTGPVTVNSTLSTSGYFYFGANTGAYPAAPGGTACALSWNFSQSAGEVVGWNCYTGANGFNSFHWRQLTGASSSTLLSMLGPAGFASYVPFFKLGGGPSFRMCPNNDGSGIGSFWYTDPSNVYLLLTANNDAWGSFNGLRPFNVSLSSGQVSMGHGLTVSAGGVTIANQTWFYGQDTAGTPVPLLTMWSDNNCYLCDTSHVLNLRGSTVNLNGPVVTSGNISPAQNIFLNNQMAIYGKDNGGTSRTLIWIDASNLLNICDQARSIVMGGPIYPTQTNVWQCGTASNYWYQIFTGAGGYQTGSDRRMKTDIEDLPDCLDLVRGIAPQRFRWRDGPDTTRTHWGFIAQDIAEVMGDEFGGYTPADPDEPESIAALNYNQLVAVLWKACQELVVRVEQLEAA